MEENGVSDTDTKKVTSQHKNVCRSAHLLAALRVFLVMNTIILCLYAYVNLIIIAE